MRKTADDTRMKQPLIQHTAKTVCLQKHAWDLALAYSWYSHSQIIEIFLQTPIQQQ